MARSIPPTTCSVLPADADEVVSPRPPPLGPVAQAGIGDRHRAIIVGIPQRTPAEENGEQDIRNLARFGLVKAAGGQHIVHLTEQRIDVNRADQVELRYNLRIPDPGQGVDLAVHNRGFLAEERPLALDLGPDVDLEGILVLGRAHPGGEEKDAGQAEHEGTKEGRGADNSQGAGWTDIGEGDRWEFHGDGDEGKFSVGERSPAAGGAAARPA